jgi:hypothetical protein
VNLRPLARGDLEAAGVLLHEAFAQAARAHGAPAPWGDVGEATRLCEAYLADAKNGEGVVADAGGAIAGLGFVRRRGEIATIGPLASAAPGQGTGSQLLDELIAHADAWGASAIRLYQDAWNPDSFALYAGRSFAVTDVVASVERPAGAPPRIDALRGLEVTPFAKNDLAELAALDLRLTGLDRAADLAASVRLVARRRGGVCGFAGMAMSGGRALLGPALALDVADLFVLVARLLADVSVRAQARLSTAVPTAMLAALGLGFRVTAVGTLMVRGVTPPARPPQLFGLLPEIL